MHILTSLYCNALTRHACKCETLTGAGRMQELPPPLLPNADPPPPPILGLPFPLPASSPHFPVPVEVFPEPRQLSQPRAPRKHLQLRGKPAFSPPWLEGRQKSFPHPLDITLGGQKNVTEPEEMIQDRPCKAAAEETPTKKTSLHCKRHQFISLSLTDVASFLLRCFF